MAKRVNTQEDYAAVDKLVEQYQSGNNTAAEELIEKFHNYILKYVSLLTGTGNITDPDCRKFLSLFIDEKDNTGARKALLSGRYTPEQKTVISGTLNSLVHACSFYELEELIHEMNVALLILASRYKEQGKGFAGYINGAYFFELGRRIKDITKDPIVFQKNTIVAYSDIIYADPEAEVDDTDILDHIDNMIMEGEDGELNNGWIQGITCSESFMCLSSLERLILKYYYGDGMTDKQIGDRIGYHTDTVRRKRVKAKEALRKELNPNGEKE